MAKIGGVAKAAGSYVKHNKLGTGAGAAFGTMTYADNRHAGASRGRAAAGGVADAAMTTGGLHMIKHASTVGHTMAGFATSLAGAPVGRKIGTGSSSYSKNIKSRRSAHQGVTKGNSYR